MTKIIELIIWEKTQNENKMVQEIISSVHTQCGSLLWVHSLIKGKKLHGFILKNLCTGSQKYYCVWKRVWGTIKFENETNLGVWS